MRIAVDARELHGRPTGVGRYLGELLAEWGQAAEARRHSWTLYAHARPAIGAPWSESVRVVDGSGGTAWEQWNLSRALSKDRPDVLFAPGYTAPLTAPAPTVLTVHDVSFFAHPEWFSFREGTRRRHITAWSARRAKVVITDSQFSKSEIVKHIGLPESRVQVIPLGIRLPERSGERPREPFVLYVGSVFARRRVDQLIAGFDRVAERVPKARLEIVGENRTIPRVDLEALCRQTRHADRITLRSYVDEPTLRDLYTRASVFAFLSEYEGFGFTPLEALAAGVPPVVLDTPIARETCGAAARYVPAGDSSALVEALVACLTGDAARRAILEHAPGVLARYDWSRTAAATLAAIEEGAGGR
ncbi:MAG: hypothetical protein A3J29_19700 [Acidobacteria bacterium RIFCSPLOWO2_12_FULL_67_14b]|nr:MAG: hypothetical protein A3J29_19700 [Acidobacteria bacterium RIFCSPLOWO2_12_FULL_67_14b]